MKIAICTPHYRQVHAEFMNSLMAMIAHTSHSAIVFNDEPVAPEIRVFTNSGSVLAYLRNRLTRDAIAWGANYLLWLDSDHTFPPDALVRLLSHNLPVIGANYARRCTPTHPTAATISGEGIWTTQELAEAGRVEQVGRLGLGVCLIDITVFGQLHRHAKAVGKETIWPLFCQQEVPNSIEVVGEDTFFFNLLHEAGIATYVDHGLSWEVGHLYEIVLMNSDAVAQRDAYLNSVRQDDGGRGD